MSAAFEKPRQRRGFVLTAVWWDRDGRVRFTKYEPDATGRNGAKGGETGQPGGTSAPSRGSVGRRGLIELDRAHRPAVGDLFAQD